jgi:hypothetical protein
LSLNPIEVRQEGEEKFKARQGKAKEGKARQRKTRQRKARQRKARQGKERKGKERKGKERKGKTREALVPDRTGRIWRFKCLPGLFFRSAALLLANTNAQGYGERA